MAQNQGGVNVGAPAQKVVQVALGEVYRKLDSSLATLDAIEDIPYHALQGGLGLSHEILETAIKRLREGIAQAREDAGEAVDQVGGVTTIGG